jgi:hypothetical protein
LQYDSHVLNAQFSSKSPYILSLADDAILRAIFCHHYLSAQQVCRLLYSRGSLTHVQSKLKRLTDSGHCQRLFLPRPSQHGSAPSVYTLARKGLNYLQNQGLDTTRRYHSVEEREHSYLFLAHTLAVNDFLISAALLCRRVPWIGLASVLHERELKRQPVFVSDSNGGKIGVIPDSWLDLQVQGSYQSCLALELDRGTVEQKQWRRKVRGLVGWAKGPYQEQFKTTSLTIAVVATPGEKRLQELVRWTQAELEAIGEKHAADLFRLTGGPPDSPVPEALFLSPCWVRPFDPQPVSLLPFAQTVTAVPARYEAAQPVSAQHHAGDVWAAAVPTTSESHPR